MNANERLKEGVEAVKYREKLTQKAIAMRLGFKNQSYLSDLVNGRFEVSERFITEFCEEFTYISPSWLLTGEGEMLRTKVESNAEVYVPPHVTEVPIIPYYARAGTLSEYEQIAQDEEYQTMMIPLNQVPHGDYLIFTVTGDSMLPELLPDDKILARHIQRHLWEDYKLHINKWRFWVIVTRSEGILVKQIVHHDVGGKRIVIHSLNEAFPDDTIDLSDVIDIYNVVQLVQRELR